MDESHQVAHLLTQTLSPDGGVVRSATDALERLSFLPNFPFSLLSISTGSEDPGLRIAAATYLKNFTRKRIDSSKVSKEFKDALLQALLKTDSAVLKVLVEAFLKVLVEAFRTIVAVEFVKENCWSDLVSQLRSVIENSNLISRNRNGEWKTINALTILLSMVRPFQYFLNPKVAKEPVPPQLEQIARDILVPLLDVFHQFVEKALANTEKTDEDSEKLMHIICKCTYLAVRSHMPSALAPRISSFCGDLFIILNSLTLDGSVTQEDGHLLRLKTGKRSLLIFCALVTRHRKVSDKLMPDIINCVSRIAKNSINISKLGFLSERIVSLAFDVISRVLETGPGWRLVSPHFSSLLDSAIFPALVLNEKDITEWEEDAEEYMRKNLPSELEEVSGWKEDLFTARNSALNFLGVMSMSKGPPVVGSSNTTSLSSKRKKGVKTRGKDHSSIGELLVLPYLSKFPIPSDSNASETRIMNEYYGVLMAYGSLQEFLSEQRAGYIITLVRRRVLPLYTISTSLPYLLASANWVLGELASCLPEEMSADVYTALLKGLTMPDMDDSSCYPVRVSAAGAITELVDNEFFPPDWLPLLQGVISQISDGSDEISVFLELLGTLVEAGSEQVSVHIPYIITSLVDTISNSIPPRPEPWPQVVEQGFATLAVMAQCWETSISEDGDDNKSNEVSTPDRATITIALSKVLQRAWLTYEDQMEGEAADFLPPPSCVEDSSALLRFIMQTITTSDDFVKLRIPELLIVWAELIANWHAWEESEDLSIFSCIKDVVMLQQNFALPNFLVGEMPSPPAPPVPKRSIIEGIGSFVSDALSQYPSATWRASSCVHLILHVPNYTLEADDVKKSLVVAFSGAAFTRFKDIRSNPCSLWKPLLLAISSCYLCYPEAVEMVLGKNEVEGFSVWVSSLSLISSITFAEGLSSESEFKLVVVTLAKVFERLMALNIPRADLLEKCSASLMEVCVRLKVAQGEKEEDDEENGDAEEVTDEEETEDEDDEDSDDVREETEEEFLNRYAEAAVALENGTLEEGDVEDQELELDLGGLEEVDEHSIMLSLMGRYHQILQRLSLPPDVVSSFLQAFPDCSFYFQQR